MAGFNESGGANEDYFAVFIQNPHGWRIQDLKPSNAQVGIALWYNAGQTGEGTTVANIDFADMGIKRSTVEERRGFALRAGAGLSPLFGFW